MNQDKKIETAQKLWAYAKSVGPVYNSNFKQWYFNRAKQLYMLSEGETLELWNMSIKMNG